MVGIAKKEIRRMDKQERQPIKENNHDIWHVSPASVKTNYMKWHPRLTSTEAEYTLQHCIEKKYLKIRTIELVGATLLEDPSASSVEGLEITRLGWKLIEKTFFVIPTGLLHAWYEEDGKVFLAAIGTAIGILLAIAGFLAKIAFSDQRININLSQTTTSNQVQHQTQGQLQIPALSKPEH